VQTPDYVQITGPACSLSLRYSIASQHCSNLYSTAVGIGDLTKINIPSGDAGGELDPHGADGNGKCALACVGPAEN